MIRINLLPQGKRSGRTRAVSVGDGNVQGWFIGYFVASILTVVLLILWYVSTKNELDEASRVNADLQSEISRIKERSAHIDEVRAKIAQSRKLEDLVAELNKARLGPTRVLMELSRILSVGGGPTVDLQELERLRRENPLAGYNASWDPRRLWITSFEETDRRCKIRGLGRTNEDVAEFLRRLQVSQVFETVTLTRTESVGSKARVGLISFELTARVKY
ncbi:MAG: PilN domain-containing protein [Myxococcales bacterium]|nr:PilN domain-containing protein [Myxococcales bacterium]